MNFSFIMIVLNGMPFIKHSLSSIYDFADEIIVIEGPVEKLKNSFQSRNFLSNDGTTEFLDEFPDPDKKIKIIRGVFNDKVDMQNLALQHSNNEWIWLVDSDEVYKNEDLKYIKRVLNEFPDLIRIDFIPLNFWKGFNFIFESEKFHLPPYHYKRIFKRQKNDYFTTHRPPTLESHINTEFVRMVNFIPGDFLLNEGITIYHYSYVDLLQVKQKIDLYSEYGWGKNWDVDLHEWFDKFYLKWNPSNRKKLEMKYSPWTGDKNSYTTRFAGQHPKEILSDKKLLSDYDYSS